MTQCHADYLYNVDHTASVASHPVLREKERERERAREIKGEIESEKGSGRVQLDPLAG